MTQAVSIKNTRDNLADIVDKVAIGGDTFIITKFGKPKAMIVPIVDKKLINKSILNETFGVWAKREDIKNSNQWVSDIRSKMSKRDE